MKHTVLFLSIICIFVCCKKSTTEPEVSGDPTAVTLLFPFENSLCNLGTDSTNTESDVVFEWSISENADQYELILKNLNTGDSVSQTTSGLKLTLRILRATPYAWYVVATSALSQTKVRSATWKFYNAGEAIENYAPFPAEIVSPKMSETITPVGNLIDLSWIGNDIDGDISGFDVYFGTTNPPPLIETNLQQSVLNGVPVLANTVYYWKIVTNDLYGNSSDSGVYQFRIR